MDSIYIFVLFLVVIILVILIVALCTQNTSPTSSTDIPSSVINSRNMTFSESLASMNSKTSFPFEVFIINLDRKTERYTYVSDQLDKLGITNYQRVSAVDGFHISKEELMKYGLGHNMSIRQGIAGCAASHISLWKHILDNKLDWTLILEDDAHFHPNFTELFPSYWKEIPANAKIIFPGYCGGDDVKNNDQLVIEKSVMCLQAYMINHESAKYLLDNLLPMDQSIDIVIENHFAKHPGSYIFNDRVTIDGIRPMDYKEQNGNRCMFDGIVYQNRKDQGSTIHKHETIF